MPGALSLEPGSSSAFPLIVRKGDTLARIAERVYGRVELEQVLVAANSLDAAGGVPIIAGMRLEVPAVSHRRVMPGESWSSLALELLGDSERSDVLAMSNDAMPWLPPTEGQEIVVPYNLTYVARAGDSTLTIAYRFLGERDKAWQLDRYNHLKGKPLRRGDVVLVPLTNLPLTPEGKELAAGSFSLVRSEGGGRARDAQRRAEAELPALAGDVREGRFVEAVSRANRILGYGELTRAQTATIYKLLTECYVALDAIGLAETACRSWRAADPAAELDPIELSPKILRACTQATESTTALPPPPASTPAAAEPAASATASAPASRPRKGK